MQNNTNLAYQAKNLAAKATVFADNLAVQVDKLSPQYQELLQVAKLRTVTEATTTALAAYDSNYEHKQMLATTAQRNLRDALASAKTEYADKKTAELNTLIAERDDLHQKWRAKCAAVHAKTADLGATQRVQLKSITVAGKEVVGRHLTDAKTFGEQLTLAYAALRKVYFEYKNLVEAVAVQLGDATLTKSVLPREATRIAHRANAPSMAAAETTANGAVGQNGVITDAEGVIASNATNV